MRLLTRGSPLAIVQAERMADAIRPLGPSVDIVPFSTRGDRESSLPLRCFGGIGAFSCCIEEALLRGEGDGAVHSFRNGPDALRHHAGREDEAVAVEHAPPVGRQLQRAGEAHLACRWKKSLPNTCT